MEERPQNNSLYTDAAREYAAHSAENFYNARYERPAMLDVAGDSRGKSVLDAGCAGGEYVAHFLAQQARVTALDASRAMVDIVRERFGDAVDVHRHDLREPIVWLKDASMDLVLSSLTLHYLRDWTVPLGEFRRILKRGGRFVMSTHHPAMVQPLLGDRSYFDTLLVRDTWRVGGIDREVHFYHRPLQDIINAIVNAGFTIRRIVEPQLKERGADLPPEGFNKLSTSPWFLIVEAGVTVGPGCAL